MSPQIDTIHAGGAPRITSGAAPLTLEAVGAAVVLTQKNAQVKREPLVNPQEILDKLAAAAEKLNEQVKDNGRGLNFAVDKVLNRPVITVKNTSTGEVVRQIPSEVVLRVAHSLEEMKGLLMDISL